MQPWLKVAAEYLWEIVSPIKGNCFKTSHFEVDWKWAGSGPEPVHFGPLLGRPYFGPLPVQFGPLLCHTPCMQMYQQDGERKVRRYGSLLSMAGPFGTSKRKFVQLFTARSQVRSTIPHPNCREFAQHCFAPQIAENIVDNSGSG